MIKKIKFKHYRKLKDPLEINFTKGVNVISGTNGTCKTSILHLVSNSFKIPDSSTAIVDANVWSTLRGVNFYVNPKIETLTKGDKTYADPARGTKGTLYTVEFFDKRIQDFRRKNDQVLADGKKRYRITPPYGWGKGEGLTPLPVVYLSLSRLVPHGEFDVYTKKKASLPEQYRKEVAELYKKLSGIDIKFDTYKICELQTIKTRAEFSTSNDGLDSNTISDGEDNLHAILTALVSLKYYFESIENSVNEIESILLIDEFDATLHPNLQLNLLKICKEFSEKYKFQTILTTHSLDLIEEGLKKEYYNVIYIEDNIENVKVLNPEQLDIYYIKMKLYQTTMRDLLRDKYIPIYTEDKEARLFLEMLLNHFAETKSAFGLIKHFFYLAESYLGCDNLVKLFKDKVCGKQFANCIGIVDGDTNLDEKAIDSNLLMLPGEKSIENLAFEFARELDENDVREFWDDVSVSGEGFDRPYFRTNILPDILDIDEKLQEPNNKKKRRELNKSCFSKENNYHFFSFVLKYWIKTNDAILQSFYNGICILYKKTSELNGINRKILKEG